MALQVSATQEDIRKFFDELYSGTDAVVTDDDVENVLRTIQAHSHWRQSLPIDQQLALVGTPVIHGPEVLNQENVPAGVTVIDPGKADNPKPTYQAEEENTDTHQE